MLGRLLQRNVAAVVVQATTQIASNSASAAYSAAANAASSATEIARNSVADAADSVSARLRTRPVAPPATTARGAAPRPQPQPRRSGFVLFFVTLWQRLQRFMGRTTATVAPEAAPPPLRTDQILQAARDPQVVSTLARITVLPRIQACAEALRAASTTTHPISEEVVSYFVLTHEYLRAFDAYALGVRPTHDVRVLGAAVARLEPKLTRACAAYYAAVPRMSDAQRRLILDLTDSSVTDMVRFFPSGTVVHIPYYHYYLLTRTIVLGGVEGVGNQVLVRIRAPLQGVARVDAVEAVEAVAAAPQASVVLPPPPIPSPRLTLQASSPSDTAAASAAAVIETVAAALPTERQVRHVAKGAGVGAVAGTAAAAGAAVAGAPIVLTGLVVCGAGAGIYWGVKRLLKKTPAAEAPAV